MTPEPKTMVLSMMPMVDMDALPCVVVRVGDSVIFLTPDVAFAAADDVRRCAEMAREIAADAAAGRAARRAARGDEVVR